MQRRFVHFHGASIGEVICAHRVYRELIARDLGANNLRFAFTYTSRYAQEWLESQSAHPCFWHARLGPKACGRTREEIAGASKGSSVLVILEKDRWPGLFRLHRTSNAVLNIEAKPPQSRRHHVFESLLGKNLRKVGHFLVENEEYGRALREYVPSARITVSGTLKAPLSQPRHLNLSGSNRVAFVSVHQEEIDVIGRILRTAKEQLGSIRALVIPRYVRRGRFSKNGQRFMSKAATVLPDIAFVKEPKELVDTYSGREPFTAVYTGIGRVSEFLQLMEIAVVCGSLEPGLKGHNFFEPMALGIPTVVGPHVRNWRWSVDEFRWIRPEFCRKRNGVTSE